MCVNNLPKVALDSAAAGIEPAISSRKSNAPNHSATEQHYNNNKMKHACTQTRKLSIPPTGGFPPPLKLSDTPPTLDPHWGVKSSYTPDRMGYHIGCM